MDKETFDKNKQEAIRKIFIRILILKMRRLFVPAKPTFLYRLEGIALYSQYMAIRHSFYTPDDEKYKAHVIQHKGKNDGTDSII